jgi:hypothetical protein
MQAPSVAQQPDTVHLAAPQTSAAPEIGAAPEIKDRAALESSCKFIEQHIAPRKCDSDGVSACWRCNSVYLAKRMRELLAAQADAAPVASPDASSTDALRDVAVERQRQIEHKGWTPEHDDQHGLGELANAAACYAATHRAFKAVECVGRGYEPHTVYRDLWPWLDEWWKPSDRRNNLVRAGALILAEIERLDRAALTRAKEVQP